MDLDSPGTNPELLGDLLVLRALLHEFKHLRTGRANVAIEIDGDPSRQDIDYDLAARAVAAGCLFALDSDAHSTGELAYSETAIAHARLAGVPTDRIVNCWPVDRLMKWLATRNGR